MHEVKDMSEPRIIKVPDPYEIETLVKANREIEAAHEAARLAALPVKEYETTSRPEEIPRITKALEPHEIEALITAEREAEARREAVAQAAAEAKAIKEYDPMPGPEGTPKVFDADAGKEVPYLSLYPVYPEGEYGQGEEPLVFEEGDPRAAIDCPQTPSRDAGLPFGYPGRETRSPGGDYAVEVLPSGAVEVTRYR